METISIIKPVKQNNLNVIEKTFVKGTGEIVWSNSYYKMLEDGDFLKTCLSRHCPLTYCKWKY